MRKKKLKLKRIKPKSRINKMKSTNSKLITNHLKNTRKTSSFNKSIKKFKKNNSMKKIMTRMGKITNNRVLKSSQLTTKMNQKKKKSSPVKIKNTQSIMIKPRASRIKK